jgi:hypothetical protein
MKEEPLIHTKHNAPDSWLGNPFYENWVKPQGIVDQIVPFLEASAALLASISFGLHESMRPIQDSQVEALCTLAPHLRRAAIISSMPDDHVSTAAVPVAVMLHTLVPRVCGSILLPSSCR